MLSSAVRAFFDPDDYTASIRATTSEIAITGRGQFGARHLRIDLHRLWMQRFSDNLPRIIHTAHIAGRAMVQFRTAPGPSLSAGGREMSPTNILRHSLADSYYHRSSGPASWAAMSLPIEDMVAAGEAMTAVDLTPPKDPLNVTPPPSVMAKLQRLHAAAGQLAEDAPEMIADPDAARGLEQALIETLVDCLAHAEQGESRLAQGHHAIVMRRFRRVMEENPEEPLFIPQICKAIRVPTRTLQMCCQEHLGMGPKRYLLLRRMHLARRALRRAEPDATTVTRIAMRYGFWQLGRFAVEYQSLFGESPSVTLGRPSA